MTSPPSLPGLVHTHRLPHCNIALFGNQPRHTQTHTSGRHDFWLANQLGAQPTKTFRIIAPSNERGRGFGTIIAPEEATIHAEGVLLTEPQSAAIISHADCAVLVCSNQKTRHVLLSHAGRPALAPCDGRNIVTTALDMIACCNELDALCVHISGSICGMHFENKAGAAREHAKRILDEFGPSVFSDVDTLSFSPASLIVAQLKRAGLSEAQISHDGLCTYNHQALSSHREHVIAKRERTTSNLTIVATH